MTDPTPTRPLTRREGLDAADHAPITYLPEPVLIGPEHAIIVVGYCTPPGAPEWLAVELSAAATEGRSHEPEPPH
jgi:hypothetical protein